MVLKFIFFFLFLIFASLLLFEHIIKCFIVFPDKFAVHLHEVVIVVSITILISISLQVALQHINGALLADLLTNTVNLYTVRIFDDLAERLGPIVARLLLCFLLEIFECVLLFQARIRTLTVVFSHMALLTTALEAAEERQDFDDFRACERVFELDTVQAFLDLLLAYLCRLSWVDMLEHIRINVAIEAIEVDLLHELLNADLLAFRNMLISIDIRRRQFAQLGQILLLLFLLLSITNNRKFVS